MDGRKEEEWPGELFKKVVLPPLGIPNSCEIRKKRVASRAKIELFVDGFRKQPQKSAATLKVAPPGMHQEVLKYVQRGFKQHMTNYGAILGQAKKIATICGRELRRGLSRTSKTNPYLKNRRINKELQRAVSKASREEKEAKKKEDAERENQRKVEEQEKEELRQQRKFNYLMSQTEAFAKFILNKQNIAGSDVGVAAAQNQLAHIKEFDEEEGKKTVYEQRTVEQPSIIKTKLRGYQLKGLNWLVNLYNQGINGILADDMGLGKTVQIISLFGWLCEAENIWGPFLVVTPASTLHNWENEINQFIHDFKVVVYYGSIQERSEMRKEFKNTNVVVTSYQVAVSDENMLKKIKWKYMVLDEAQAIKSINSQRWSTLLSFKARNRCLLTGTPIQNNMQELWSLLHFIMPTLFDSLSEFKDWFLTENQVNENEISKLHTILKPFMLRRHKEDIKDEIGTKEIIHIYCDMSPRQKSLYEAIQNRVSSNNYETKGNDYDNVIMQLKKVCNHPSLFEREEIQSAFSLTPQGEGSTLVEPHGSLVAWIPEITVLSSGDLSNIPRRINEQIIDRDVIEDVKRFCIERKLGDSYNTMSYWKKALKTKLQVVSALSDTLRFTTNPVMIQKVETPVERRQEMFVTVHRTPYIPIPSDISSLAAEQRQRLEGNRLLNKMAPFCSVPPLNTLISDSGKLKAIDYLLTELQNGDHKVLIYFQMTKMMDLFEEYLVKRGLSYIRLDGSVRVSTRKELVSRWQAGEVFIFILSTRAGGVGINLTTADTVIFYDSDWNPTVDHQAMDRAHRLGQKRPVTVYRLITRNSIEEKIIEKASKKDAMQKIVIQGQVFNH